MKVPPGIQWRQSLELVETRRNGRLLHQVSPEELGRGGAGEASQGGEALMAIFGSFREARTWDMSGGNEDSK